MGTNAELGAILLRSVHVEAPSDPDYDPGDAIAAFVPTSVWLSM